MRHPRLSRSSAVVVAVVLGVLSGCSSDGSDTSDAGTGTPSGTTGPPAVCAAADDLQTSMAGLADVQVVQNGTASLQTAVDAVQTDLERLVDDATAQYAPQVDDLQTGFDAVRAAASAAVSAPSAATLQAVTASISALAADVQGFADDLGSTC